MTTREYGEMLNLRTGTKIRKLTGLEETASNGSKVGKEGLGHTLKSTAFLTGFYSVGLGMGHTYQRGLAPPSVHWPLCKLRGELHS